jgi:hypothetical protein
MGEMNFFENWGYMVVADQAGSAQSRKVDADER